MEDSKKRIKLDYSLDGLETCPVAPLQSKYILKAVDYLSYRRNALSEIHLSDTEKDKLYKIFLKGS